MPRFPAASPTSLGLSDRVYSDLVRKAQGRPGPLYSLHVGDTYRDPPQAAWAEAHTVEDHPRLHNYAPVQGEPVLLKAIVDRLHARYGTWVDREHVQVMCGATAGFNVVCSTILDPGDEVILLSPFWPLIRGIVTSRGAMAVEVPFFDRMGEAAFDPEQAIEVAISPRTVALYVNTPNNPTGKVIAPRVRDAIAKIVLRHDLWLLCDEAYEEITFGDGTVQPLWARADLHTHAIALHTFSKSYGMAGARVGYAHGPASVMGAVRSVQTFLTYCAPRPMQFAALRALEEGEEWLEETRGLYREAALASATALNVATPEGGTFVFFDASPYLRADEPIMKLLERCLDVGVLLTPGGASGKHYERWARLCFTAVPPDALEDALGRLRTVLVRP